MTIFDLFPIMGVFSGFAVGFYFGALLFGWPGGIAGAIAGSVPGYLCGRIPLILASAYFNHELRTMKSEKIRKELRGSEWAPYRKYFEELFRREEDLNQELPVVLNLLASRFVRTRYDGWFIAKRFFPELVARMPDYDPTATTDICQARVELAKLKA